MLNQEAFDLNHPHCAEHGQDNLKEDPILIDAVRFNRVDIVKEMMKPGALFITSGIIDEREDDVREALIRNGFEIMEVTHSGGWVSFTAKAC